jgi:hypothetical protein
LLDPEFLRANEAAKWRESVNNPIPTPSQCVVVADAQTDATTKCDILNTHPLIIGPLGLAAVGLFGALLTWALVDRIPTWESGTVDTKAPPSAEQQEILARVGLLNEINPLACFGAVIALTFSATLAVVHRSWQMLLSGILAGVVLGASGGFLGGWTGHRIRFEDMPIVDVARNLLEHALTWGLLGAGVGLAVALPSGRVSLLGKALVGAALAGVVAAAGYVVIAAILFPSYGVEGIASADQGIRLAVFCLNGMLMGAFIGVACAPAKNQLVR